MAGFMEDSGGAFNNGFMNSQSPNKRFDGNRVESIVPVSVRQVHLCQKTEDDSFQIDGASVQQVTLVGLIASKDVQETKIVYHIDDGSGLIETIKWLSRDGEQGENSEDVINEFPELSYVRIFGVLRSFKDTMSVLIYGMRKVEDYNEVTYHLAEVMNVHKEHTTQASTIGGATVKDMQDNFNSNMNESSNFSRVQDIVLNFVQGNTTEEGPSVDEIIRGCSSSFPEGQVREAIQFLTQEGHLYSTVDENHFKSTAF